MIISDNGRLQTPPPISSGKEIRAGDGKSLDISIRQASIDRSPACAVVGGEKDAATSPGKEIRARDGKSTDISIGQASIDRSPACAVVGGKKDAADQVPAKRFVPETARAVTSVFGQAGIDRSPACAVVGGKKDAATSSGKEIRAGDGKSTGHE